MAIAIGAWLVHVLEEYTEMLSVSLGELGVALNPRRPQFQFASRRERKLYTIQEQMEAECRGLEEQDR